MKFIVFYSYDTEDDSELYGYKGNIISCLFMCLYFFIKGHLKKEYHSITLVKEPNTTNTTNTTTSNQYDDIDDDYLPFY